MNRRFPNLPPGDDLPPEVLDELLHAFSADPAKADEHLDIDLSSPEVAQLLQPSDPAGDARPPEEGQFVEAVEHAQRARPSTAATADPGEARTSAPPIVITDSGSLDAGPGAERGGGHESPAQAATVVIADDENMPDAMYLDSDLEPAEGRSPLVINDDTSMDTVPVESATGVMRIEPRMRDRRAAVRRARFRHRLVWIGLVVAVLLIVVASLAVLGSGLFAVEDVEVTGVERTSEEAIDEIVRDLQGTPTLLVDEATLEKRLETSPWVDSARITTDFPHGATIEISERTPDAVFAGADGNFRVIDREGRVLEVVPVRPADQVLVTIDGAPSAEAGQFMGIGYRAAAALAHTLTPEVRVLVTGITAAADGSDIRMQLSTGTEVRFGEGRDLNVKLVRLETEIGDIVEQQPAVIDVSTAEVTVIR